MDSGASSKKNTFVVWGNKTLSIMTVFNMSNIKQQRQLRDDQNKNKPNKNSMKKDRSKEKKYDEIKIST